MSKNFDFINQGLELMLLGYLIKIKMGVNFSIKIVTHLGATLLDHSS